MKTRCPNCGAVTSLDALFSDSTVNQAFLAELVKAPSELQESIILYLGLFRSNSRELQFKKATALLQKLNPVIASGELTYKHQTTAAPTEAWVWGIETLIENQREGKLSIPLKNNNYLFAVVQTYKETVPESQQVGAPIAAPEPYKPAFDIASRPKGLDAKNSVLMNGVWKACFKNMNQSKTLEYVTRQRRGAETTDETYDRLVREMKAKNPTDGER